MQSNEKERQVLNLLKEKLIAIFRLIYKIKNFDQFVIYININNDKFISLLDNQNREIEEDKLMKEFQSYLYWFEKTNGNFKALVGYMGDNSMDSLESVDNIKDISFELMSLILNEAIDLQKRVQKEDKIMELQEKCQYDGLTGLYNRETFSKLYGDIYKTFTEENREFSVLMLDIDNFKNVNDNYGHQFGDKVLKQVADKIKINVRRNDIVARYGGEEFIIILVDIADTEAEIIAERIRDSIANFKTDGVGVTISIGISNFKKDEHLDGDKLIYIADKHLYEAKRLGKNTVNGKRSEK